MTDFLSRLQEITWKSPRGKLFILKTPKSGYKRKHIGEVKNNPVGKKAVKKKIVESRDTFTDSGVSGRDVSLDCYFIGSNHDIEAAEFDKSLCEVGKSRLRLAYGEEFSVNVIDYSLNNELIEKINCTIISVNFHETSPSVYPKATSSGIKRAKNNALQANSNTAQSLADAATNIQDPVRRSKFRTSYNSMLNTVSNVLNVTDNVSLNAIMTDILGQDVLTNAYTMTYQLQNLMYKATSAVNGAKSNLTSFDLLNTFTSTSYAMKNFISSLISQFSASNKINTYDRDMLLISHSAASSAIAALAQSSVESDYETRKDALDAAKDLIDTERQWNDFVEEKAGKIDDLKDAFIKDSDISEVVSSAAAEILDKSYELKIEKSITLSEDTPIIELAYKYYPEEFSMNPDETINYLICTNGFFDDEFFILKRGRKLKVYV